MNSRRSKRARFGVVMGGPRTAVAAVSCRICRPGRERCLAGAAFLVEQRALALEAPAVAADATVAAQHAMTGHQHRDPVGGYRRGGGPYRLRRIDRGGDLAVAHDLAGLDRQQEAPDADLERRAAQVERQLRWRPVVVEARLEGGDPGVELG